MLIGVVVRSTMYAKLVYNLTSVSNICIKIEEINNVLAEQMMRLLQIRICTLKASTSKTCEKNSDNYTHTILPSYDNATMK